MQDFIIPTERVEWGSNGKVGFDVRGLSVQDITILFTTHGASVDKIFSFIEGAHQGDDGFDVKEFGADLIIKAPQVVAQMIALAADMPDQAVAARMPLPVQIRALEQIYKLTIEETGGLTDFLALVLRLIQSAKQAIPSMSSQQNLNLNNTGS